MYYDIHTHQCCREKNTTAILNYSVGEFGTFCGLDMQRTFYSLGIHPWKIREENISQHFDFIEKTAAFDAVKAIGECGLDKLCDTPLPLQEKVFLSQIRISEKLEKPLTIHCVKAIDELIAFRKEIKPQQPWIIHGFRGNFIQAKQLINQGFFLSFGAKFNDEALKITPLEKLFLETDDLDIPVASVYEKVALCRNIAIDELIGQIKLNFDTCFSQAVKTVS